MGRPLEDQRRVQFDLLTRSRSWMATPDVSASMRFLRFLPDGRASLVFGYGQTIFARLDCQFDLPMPGILAITYLESPSYQYFKGYTPDPAGARKDLYFSLARGPWVFTDPTVSQTTTYAWRLELSGSPFPDELQLPYETPLTYYGFAEKSALTV